MKKKNGYIVFLLFFVFGLLSVFPQSASADCSSKPPRGSCSAGRVTCGSYCCDLASECNASVPTTPPTPGTSDTTGGTTENVDSNVKCKDDETGINTAIGCIHVLGTPETFLADILRWAVGIGGGIAFLLILYAGFMIMTGAGNPERLKAGQELLTSAISGLILLIFSIFILNFIGVDILGLGAFGFGK